jgi:hypothetical protein
MSSTQNIINERQANLPLPEQPPQASDWNSADERTVNVGSGGLSDDIATGNASSSLREPATGPSALRVDGEEWKTNATGNNGGRQGRDELGGLPNDAVTRNKKDAANTVNTTGNDYGYPQKNDPSSERG